MFNRCFLSSYTLLTFGFFLRSFYLFLLQLEFHFNTHLSLSISYFLLSFFIVFFRIYFFVQGFHLSLILGHHFFLDILLGFSLIFHFVIHIFKLFLCLLILPPLFFRLSCCLCFIRIIKLFLHCKFIGNRIFWCILDFSFALIILISKQETRRYTEYNSIIGH